MRERKHFAKTRHGGRIQNLHLYGKSTSSFPYFCIKRINSKSSVRKARKRMLGYGLVIAFED